MRKSILKIIEIADIWALNSVLSTKLCGFQGVLIEREEYIIFFYSYWNIAYLEYNCIKLDFQLMPINDKSQNALRATPQLDSRAQHYHFKREIILFAAVALTCYSNWIFSTFHCAVVGFRCTFHIPTVNEKCFTSSVSGSLGCGPLLNAFTTQHITIETNNTQNVYTIQPSNHPTRTFNETKQKRFFFFFFFVNNEI